jgi:hypothetical protein
MDRENIKEMIQTATKDGRITCSAAFRVAEEADVTVGLIGQLINEMEIRIKGCQLGCF